MVPIPSTVWPSLPGRVIRVRPFFLSDDYRSHNPDHGREPIRRMAVDEDQEQVECVHDRRDLVPLDRPASLGPVLVRQQPIASKSLLGP